MLSIIGVLATKFLGILQQLKKENKETKKKMKTLYALKEKQKMLLGLYKENLDLKDRKIEKLTEEFINSQKAIDSYLKKEGSKTQKEGAWTPR